MRWNDDIPKRGTYGTLVRVNFDDVARRRKVRCGHEFHGFMALPTELRCEIYKVSLVRRKFFVRQQIGRKYYHSVHHMRGEDGAWLPRYGDFDSIRRDPITSGLLLGMNSSIHEEAVDVFLKYNTFHLPENLARIPLPFSGSVCGQRFMQVGAVVLAVWLCLNWVNIDLYRSGICR